MRGSRLTFFCVGQKLLVGVRKENWLGLWWRSQLTWSRCGGSNSNWFQCRNEVDWLLCGWYKWTSCLYAGRNHCFFRVKTDFVFCGWSKWTWYQCGGSNMTWFQGRVEVNLVVVWVVEIDSVFERGAKITCFTVWACKSSYILWGLFKMTWFEWDGSNMTRFQLRRHGSSSYVGCRKWPNIGVVDRHWFGFCLADQKYLFLAVGSKLAEFFLSGHWNRLENTGGIIIDLVSVIGSK